MLYNCYIRTTYVHLCNNNMELWQQTRTALYVLKHGTISAAADALAIHRATVIRHVDELEAHLNSKLFQRHQRGYTPTEAGLKLQKVAETADQQFQQLAQELNNQTMCLSGPFIVTSLPGMDAMLMPVLQELQTQHPQIQLHLHASERLYQMEVGEAHVAIRAGQPAADPDYVVIKLMDIPAALYASRGYVEQFGQPSSIEQLHQHRIIGLPAQYIRIPFMTWLYQHGLDKAISMEVAGNTSMIAAIKSGLGLGFLSSNLVSEHDDLIEIMPPQADWQSPLWIVTHKDLHHSPKVQAFLTLLDKHIPFRAR